MLVHWLLPLRDRLPHDSRRIMTRRLPGRGSMISRKQRCGVGFVLFMMKMSISGLMMNTDRLVGQMEGSRGDICQISWGFQD